MPLPRFALLFVLTALSCPVAAIAQDWPQWRGPTGDNHAAAGATAPIKWSDKTNLAWRTPIPGRGHSSPTIIGDRIYLTTADESAGTQSLLVVDKSTGKLLRETVVHKGGLPGRIHGNNSHASPTVASDGQRVFALFYQDGGAWVTAFDLAGAELWQQRVCGFDPQMYQFGFGSSPRLVDGKLIIAAEYDGPDSGIYALSPADGSQVWKAPRREGISFSTPIDVVVNGQRQLLISGAGLIAAYDASNGAELWKELAGAAATCGTMVVDPAAGLAFASGGFPNDFTLAIPLTGDHQVVWENRAKCYEQSMLLVDGYLYAVTDRGVAYCWRAEDGEEQWKKRLGGSYSASPVLVGGNIYISSEQGTTFVFRATPDRYEQLAENQLGTDCFPTTTPSSGRLYHRYGSGQGDTRQEYLAAIGE
ncbi:outer membrane biogenesis protein BamB [Posidoniimonas polymericola]|uniref:Outer membrane biogenesis protein BamB n=1 Tax=Posidoniimonas polymericola TaxID=2528002 RepID=A0A5C5YRK6_9BACT|nr:PQQ-binding-like beta-propeller repeat protein [Posidoniimonas polymericola]TWT77525.1 outer membrane biogenesis protein BamB [Posidoniimonas polymericola]